MADNTTLNVGTGGDVIATDDIGGVKYQRVKVNFGADGASADVSDANPLPIEISDGTNLLAVDTAYADNETNTRNHLNVGANTQGFNGTTWDRVRSTTTTFKCATYTAAQTGTALWTPAAGKAVVVTSIQIQSYGTTAGTCAVWFGASADTAYTRGTDAPIFDGEFVPTATNKPGFAMNFPVGNRGTADYVLRVTTTNAQSVTVNVWGYEV